MSYDATRNAFALASLTSESLSLLLPACLAGIRGVGAGLGRWGVGAEVDGRTAGLFSTERAGPARTPFLRSLAEAVGMGIGFAAEVGGEVDGSAGLGADWAGRDVDVGVDLGGEEATGATEGIPVGACQLDGTGACDTALERAIGGAEPEVLVAVVGVVAGFAEEEAEYG